MNTGEYLSAGKENEDPARQSPCDHRDDKTLEENNNHFAMVASSLAGPGGVVGHMAAPVSHPPLPDCDLPSPSSSSSVCVSTSTSTTMDACDGIDLGMGCNLWGWGGVSCVCWGGVSCVYGHLHLQ